MNDPKLVLENGSVIISDNEETVYSPEGDEPPETGEVGEVPTYDPKELYNSLFGPNGPYGKKGE